MKLSDVVAAFTEFRAEWDPLHAVSCTSESPDTIIIALNVDGRHFDVSALYMMPESYPSSACLVTERTESTDSKLQDKLAAVSEKLQDKAPFSLVLKRVCQALDVPLVEDELRAVESKILTNSAAGNSMDEDAGSDEMSITNKEKARTSTAACWKPQQPMSEGCSDSDAADDAESDDGSYDGGSGDDEADKELLIECGQRQGRWKRYEEELEKMHTKQQQLSMEQGLASKRQIFSSGEGFQMLSNELLGFIKRQDFNITADSAGDDLYTWNVSLWKSAFDPSCQLSKDLNEVSNKWAVSSIQLRFTFMRGLHPFYPPRLEVVQPHLTAPLPGALASHPLLQLRHWDPWLNMSQLLDKLREFLEVHGSVDVANPRNGDPVSAFSPVQVALARLEAIADVKPMCYSRCQELYDARNAQRRESTPGELPQQLKKQRTADTAAAAGAAAGAAGAAAGAAGAAAAAAAVSGPGGLTDPGTVAASTASLAAGAAGAAALAACKQVVWAKGTGYGYGYHGRTAGTGATWDAKQAAAAQEAQDQQLCELLQGLAHALEQELPGSSITGTAAAATAAAADVNGDTSKPQTSEQQAEDQEMADANSDDNGDAHSISGYGSLTPAQQECLSAIGESVLLPLLAKEFGTVSFSEMTARHHYYQLLLDVLQALCRPCAEHLLVMDVHAAEQQSAAAAASSSNTSSSSATQSVAGAIRGLVKSTKMYRDRMAKVLESQQTGAAATASSSGVGVGASASNAAKQQESLLNEAQRSMQIADTLLQLSDRLQHLSPAEDALQAADANKFSAAAAAAGQRGGRVQRRNTRAASKNAAAAAAASAATTGAAAVPSGEAAGSSPTASGAGLSYEATLKGLVLDSAPLSRFHSFKGEADREPLSLKARVQRVTSEMAGIERLIVVSECSSIFVRVDDDNSFLWRALITGPEDTPYSGGVFIFDMFFPPNYPVMPPKVLLRTTGNGSVRFNPNLYNCGKVCLSLLGTWSGGQGESWNPEVSSAFQVLVSIQSLILVPEPYFNEPGYEQRGDTQASKEYNKNIREATIKWAMIDQLQHPPAEFAAVIQAHFKMRGEFVLKQIQGWIDEARADHAGLHASRLEQLKGDLATELNKLT